MKPIKIIYHAVKDGIDCPDGICAAWVTVRALGLKDGEYELIPIAHKNNDEYFAPDFQLPFEPEGDIYMLDFVYPEAIIRSLIDNENIGNIVVIDHHKNQNFIARLIDASGAIDGIFDIAECGATAAWKYFHGSGIAGKISEPWFLPYVRERDTGSNGYYSGLIPKSEAIGEAMSIRRKQFGVGVAAFPFFDRLVDTDKEELIAEGLPLIEARDRAIDRYFEEASVCLMDVASLLVPFFDLQSYPDLHKHYSMVGAKGALLYQIFPFVAITTDGKNISLRSCDDGMDVALVAKTLGGGGHEHAAGYKI